MKEYVNRIKTITSDYLNEEVNKEVLINFDLINIVRVLSKRLMETHANMTPELARKLIFDDPRGMRYQAGFFNDVDDKKRKEFVTLVGLTESRIREVEEHRLSGKVTIARQRTRRKRTGRDEADSL